MYTGAHHPNPLRLRTLSTTSFRGTPGVHTFRHYRRTPAPAPTDGLWTEPIRFLRTYGYAQYRPKTGTKTNPLSRQKARKTVPETRRRGLLYDPLRNPNRTLYPTPSGDKNRSAEPPDRNRNDTPGAKSDGTPDTSPTGDFTTLTRRHAWPKRPRGIIFNKTPRAHPFR